ncbi:YicC/YloC family endoribonuclease [Pseudooceanicola algae]|uniref:YicC family protein n=1 Tax=Pseudooceanicola algae TaxID=1537215 RepID=A0A418SES6_9RHOB|nr:YicC/YloC family endoribonuclease [Pseudooceanicola algae]QPM89739.1 hypothetical protein PSAL_009650 [Pseudooceanicola algae]
MARSMTAFSTAQGQAGSFHWTWEIRSVNAKGLDLRLRVPDWIAGLEAGLRKRLGQGETGPARGNVTLNLRVSRDEAATALTLNSAQLSAVLEALADVEKAAAVRGLTLAPSRAADLLPLRGVLDTVAAEVDSSGLLGDLLADFDPVLADFMEMRDREGAAIAEVLLAQLARIEALIAEAERAAKARAPKTADAIRIALNRVLETLPGQDPQRIAQELAIIAIKSDVTEELDRLGVHVVAARELLAETGPIGRKLDFLSQEFNREANTLCAKSQDSALSAAGLEMKAVIDQMREQVQNIE